MPSPDASHSQAKGYVKSGNDNTGQLLITSLSLSKALCAVSVQLNAPFLVKSVRGVASCEKPFTKTSKLRYILGLWPIPDGPDVLFVQPHSINTDDMPQIKHLSQPKLALRQFCVKLLLL